MKNRITADVIGILVAAVGVLWILHGFNAFNTTGGMNGNKTWSWIGFVVAFVGLAILYVFNRPRKQS